MCYVGERLDSGFKLINEGGSSWFRLQDPNSNDETMKTTQNFLKFDHHSSMPNDPKDLDKLMVLQGFNKFLETKTNIVKENELSQIKDDQVTEIDANKQTLKLYNNDPSLLHLNPFTIFPDEF